MTEKNAWPTTKQVVEEYGSSEKTWCARAKAGLVVARTDSKPFRFERASLEAFMRGKKHQEPEADTSQDKEKAELEKEIAGLGKQKELYDLRQEVKSRRLGFPNFEKFEEERDSLAERIANLEQREDQVRQAEEAIKQREDRIGRLADRVSAAHVSLREQREMLLGDYEDMDKIYKDAKPVFQKLGMAVPKLAYKAFYEGEGGLTPSDINDEIGNDIDAMLEELGEEEVEE